jgi:hypothetical protein
MRFTIKSENLEHKDQIIDLNFSKIEIINDLDFPPKIKNNLPIYYDENIYKYNLKSIWAEYIGPSRIDGFPLFQIDTIQLDREEKISEILK